MRPVRRAARAMLSAIFVVQGAQAVRSPDQLASRAKAVTDRLAPQLEKLHPKLAADERTFVRLNGAAQVVGGLLLNTGAHRAGAALLAGSLVPTTLAGHAFWAVDDEAQKTPQRIQFLKNMGLLGGLLLATADTEGRPSVGWRTRHAIADANRSVQRSARTAKDKTRLAVRAANVGRHLPG